MPILLQTFAESGETAYIGKHNANVAALIAFLGSMESTLASVGGAGSGLANSGNIGKATYGTSGMSFIGTGSFADSLPLPSTLRLTDGFCWDASTGLMHYKSSATDLDFTGLAPATYYIRFNGASEPYIDTITTGAIYSVAWGGAALTDIVQLATVTPNAPDYADISDSVYSGLSYLTPVERLEATEKAFSVMLNANMSSGDFTPTVAQAMEAIGVRVFGALTTNNTLFMPELAKVILVRNDCTTSNASTVTIKTAAGTGVTLLAGEHAVLYCDGTNVNYLLRQGGAVVISSLKDLSDVPDSYTGMGLRLLRVREDLTGIEFIDPAALSTFALSVEEEGAEVDPAVNSINVTGAGATVTQTAPGQITINIPGTGATALAVQDEGVAVDSATVVINFEGDGVTVTQTAAGQVLVTIPGAGAPGAVDYDIPLYIADKRAAGSAAFRHTFTKAVNFAANFTLSDADAVTAATASAVWLIKKNGVEVGTLTFAAAGSVGTFASSGGLAVSFLVGDILEITAPTPQDATLAGVSITLAGVRA